MEKVSAPRLVGLDALRILAMLMIPVLHLLGAGGFLSALSAGSRTWWAASLLNALCFCAVDCYGLISGYVSSGRPHPLARLRTLWLQVFFYSVTITAAFALVMPDALRLRDKIAPVIPVINGTYWYFTAFFGLSLLMPFLDDMLSALDRAKAHRLTLTLLLVFSVLASLAPEDILGTRAGYSLIWLVVLYLAGGCLRRFPPERLPRPRLCVLGYLACCLVSLGGKYLTERFALPVGGRFFQEYTALPVLFSAVFLLLAMRELHPPRLLSRLISFCAPLSFGVYLLHTHPLVWTWLLTGAAASLALRPGLLSLPGLLLMAAGIFLVGIFVDFLRERLFALLRLLYRRLRPAAKMRN